MKIGIHIAHKTKEPFFLDDVVSGNPGVGGARYCFLLLAYSLIHYAKNDSFIIYAGSEILADGNARNIITDDWTSLFKSAKEEHLDILIVKTPFEKQFYDILSQYPDIKVILWSHNFFKADVASYISKSPNIVAHVVVSKQMYDNYIDNNIIKKTTPIFNAVPDRNDHQRKAYTPHTCVYMGSIIKVKGIIELFKIWKYVAQRYPDAVLHVIGGGNLYDKNSKLGPLGIADEQLESEMQPYIIDTTTGKIKDSIIFHGVMKEEKYEVFEHCAVGIVNPSSKTETFGMGIIEMASAGLPVVTKAWNAHFDTVENGKTGLLAYSLKGQAEAIMRLFENEKLNRKLGQNAKARMSMFSPEVITKQWYYLIEGITNGTYSFKRYNISSPWWNNFKFIRATLAFIRFNMHCTFIPDLTKIEFLLGKIKRILH